MHLESMDYGLNSLLVLLALIVCSSLVLLAVYLRLTRKRGDSRPFDARSASPLERMRYRRKVAAATRRGWSRSHTLTLTGGETITLRQPFTDSGNGATDKGSHAAMSGSLNSSSDASLGPEKPSFTITRSSGCRRVFECPSGMCAAGGDMVDATVCWFVKARSGT